MQNGTPKQSLFCFLLMASLLGFAHGAPQTTGVDTPITITTKFDTATDHPLVRIVINDVPFWCALDTGFSALMAFDRTKAAQAHLVESAGRPTPDGIAPYRGDGSAGASLFRQYVIEFDHVMPRIRLHDRARYTPPANAAGVPLIFRTNPNVPFVQVSLELPDGTRQQLQTVVDAGTTYYALAVIPSASSKIRDRLPVAERPVRAETAPAALFNWLQHIRKA